MTIEITAYKIGYSNGFEDGFKAALKCASCELINECSDDTDERIAICPHANRNRWLEAKEVR